MKRNLYCVVVMAGLLFPLSARAQSDGSEIPLGDLARSLRKDQGVPGHTVIDNDNILQVLEEVERSRLTGAAPTFSIEDSGKRFKISSPDVTCSMSFNAQVAPLLFEQFVSQDLPDAELTRLEGPATLDGDTLQVSLHNGTNWVLREITVGLTIIRHQDNPQTVSGVIPKLVPAAQIVRQDVVGDSTASAPPAPPEKRSDVTVLIHLKGAAAPLSTAVFRQSMGAALSPDQEWHWAIVKAKGIPPQTASPLAAQPATAAPVAVPAPNQMQTQKAVSAETPASAKSAGIPVN